MSKFDKTADPEININQIQPPLKKLKFKLKSKWNPPAPNILEHMVLLNLKEVADSYPKINCRSNLTGPEKLALLSLLKNDNIVIKKAGKG